MDQSSQFGGTRVLHPQMSRLCLRTYAQYAQFTFGLTFGGCQNHLILLKKSISELIFLARLEAGVLREHSGGTLTNDGTNATDRAAVLLLPIRRSDSRGTSPETAGPLH